MRQFAAVFVLLTTAGLLGQASIAGAQEPAPPELTFPFAAGETWRITCAYADSTDCQHRDDDWNRHALDFQHTDGPKATTGRPVLASADGTVEIADWGGADSFGWYVQLDHGDGYRTVYAHMREQPSVQPGDTVARGDALGETGCTGRCTGPHIHFAFMHDGASIPPEPMCGEDGFDDGQIHTGCAAQQLPAPQPAGTSEPGDATCDGVTNVIDAAIVLQLGAELLEEIDCPGAADVNWDDTIDSVDAVLIMQFNAGLLASLWRGEWTSGAPMPTPRTEVTSAEVDGVIYVIGGFREAGDNSGVVEAYDTATDTWSTKAPYPHPIDHAMGVAAYDKVFVFGGYTQFGGRAISSAMHVYDPATGEWTAGPDLPKPRAAGAAVIVNGIVFIMGGVGPDPTVPLAYDPVSNTWTELEPMSAPREHLTASVIDGKIFVVGGRENIVDNLDIVEVYDPATDTWDVIDPLPTARGGLTSATLDGRVHVIGGEDLAPGGSTFGDHDVWSPLAGSWKPAAPLPTPRHGLTAQVVDGKLYVIGGGPEPYLSVSDAVEIFEPPVASDILASPSSSSP